MSEPLSSIVLAVLAVGLVALVAVLRGRNPNPGTRLRLPLSRVLAIYAVIALFGYVMWMLV